MNFMHPKKTYIDKDGNEQPIPEKLIRKEERVPYPVMIDDGHGKLIPKGGTDEFMWQGFKIYCELTTIPQVSYSINPEYLEVDKDGFVIGEYTFTGGRKEKVLVHDAQVGAGTMMSLEATRARAVMDEQASQKNMLQKIMTFIQTGKLPEEPANVAAPKVEIQEKTGISGYKGLHIDDVKAAGEVKAPEAEQLPADAFNLVKANAKEAEIKAPEEKPTDIIVDKEDANELAAMLAKYPWLKVSPIPKQWNVLILCFFLTCLSSCKFEQSILKGGCKIQEFTTVNVNTDSTGIILICDNPTLVKQFPNLSAKILSRAPSNFIIQKK